MNIGKKIFVLFVVLVITASATSGLALSVANLNVDSDANKSGVTTADDGPPPLKSLIGLDLQSTVIIHNGTSVPEHPSFYHYFYNDSANNSVITVEVDVVVQGAASVNSISMDVSNITGTAHTETELNLVHDGDHWNATLTYDISGEVVNKGVQMIPISANISISTQGVQDVLINYTAAVININPKYMPIMGLNNPETTDWRDIEDFSNVTGLTFQHSNVTGGLDGELKILKPVNLLDLVFIENLQNLGNNLKMASKDMSINNATDAMEQFNGSAELTFYNLSYNSVNIYVIPEGQEEPMEIYNAATGGLTGGYLQGAPGMTEMPDGNYSVNFTVNHWTTYRIGEAIDGGGGYIDVYPGDGASAIQTAINNANESDTILVHAGTYNENVVVNKSLTLIGDGSASTIVSAQAYGDHVFNITANFVNISGFMVENATGTYKAGIYLNGREHCNISDNTASNNYYGICLYSSSNNNTITSNTANSSKNYGIYLYSSSNNTLTSNTANLNTVRGIYLDQSSNNNTLTNNTANSNIQQYGIHLHNSSNNTLTNNTANSNNDYGIYLNYLCNYNTLTSNTANSNNDYGIKLYYNCDNNRIYNNYFNNTNNAWDDGNNVWNITETAGTNIVGGSYLGGNYWSDYAGTDTDSDGLGDTQIPYNSSGGITNGGDCLPLVIAGGGSGYIDVNPGDSIQTAINDASEGDTILVHAGTYNENVNVDKRLTIQSVSGAASTTVNAATPYGHVFGVTASYVSISGFTVTGAGTAMKAGIYLGSGVEHCDISNNNASGNVYGIELDQSSNNTIINNTANANSNYGIFLSPNPGNNDYNTITNNTVNANGKDGINMWDSDYNAISGNTVNSNPEEGIVLINSNNSDITCNLVANNGKYGFYVFNSIGNTIQNNNILFNDVYDIYNIHDENNVDARFNFWGTTDSGAISNNISGTVDFSNFLTSPAPCAPSFGDGDGYQEGNYSVNGTITYDGTASGTVYLRVMRGMGELYNQIEEGSATGSPYECEYTVEVEPGTYGFEAFVDLDSNGMFDFETEPIGMYPNNPVDVVSSNLSNIDIVIGEGGGAGGGEVGGSQGGWEIAADPANVSGYILNGSKIGIPNATVVVGSKHAQGEGPTNWTKTDINGHYNLTGNVGEGDVLADAFGYHRNHTKRIFFADNIVNHTLEAADSSDGAVDGFVRNSTGAGVKNALVVVVGGGFEGSGGEPMPVGADITASDGYYHINGIPAGTYEMIVFAKGYAPEFEEYIYVSSGVTKRINFELGAGGTVTGRVVNATNLTEGIANVEIGIFDPWGGYGSSANTNDTGYYYLTVPEGWNYEMEARPPSGSGYAAAKEYDVMVMSGETKEVNFRLTSGTTICGYVKDGNENPVDNADVSVFQPYWGGFHMGTNANETGYYSLTVQEGTYEMEVRPPSSSGLSSVYESNIYISGDAPYWKNFTLSQGGSISGKVTDSSGGDIPNIHLNAWSYEGGGGWAETNDTGYYTITGLANGTYEVCVETWDSEYSGGCIQNIPVVTGQNTPGKNFELSQGGSISGWVTSNGNSVQGAGVDAWSESGGGGWSDTDDTGYYKISGLTNGTYEVHVMPPPDSNSAGATIRGIKVIEGEDTPKINFSLSAGGTIRGQVTDNNGVGIKDVNLNAWSREGTGWGWAMTDADGNYTMTGLANGTYEVEAQPPWGTTYSSNRTKGITVTAGVTTEQNFVLGTGASISGHVNDTDGNPIADANINAWSESGGWGWANTDHNGNYTITGLTAGRYEVEVNPPWGSDYTTARRKVEVTEGGKSGVDFTLSSGGSISGRVTDGEDNGIAWANVNAWSMDGGWGWAETDSNGNYTINGLVAGDYEVQVEGPWSQGYTSAREEHVSVMTDQNTPGIDFVLSRGGSISGHVNISGGDPIAYANLNAWTRDGSGWGWAETDVNGDYTINGLTEGTYEVEVMPPWGTDYTSARRENILVGAGAEADVPDINFTLSSGATISGRVVDTATDKGIQWAHVNAWTYLPGVENGWGWTETNDTGYYTIPGLIAGTYEVEVQPPWGTSYTSDRKKGISVSESQDISGINFNLSSGGSVSGKVTDSNGDGIPWVNLNAWSDKGGWGWTESDSSGNYTITGLSTGQYEVSVEPPWDSDYTSARKRGIAVVSGEDTSDIDFTLTSGGKIVGWITKASTDEGIAWANLNAWSHTLGGEGGWGWADSNSEGYYEITGLTTGSYEVEVWPPWGTDYSSNRTRGVDVTAGESTTLNFSLSAAGIIVGSVNDSDGEPVVRAHVNAWSRHMDGGGGWAETDSKGNYTMRGLASGEYEVNVEPPWDSNYASAREMGVVVAEGNTTYKNFTLSEGSKITGNVTDIGGNPIAYAHVNAWSHTKGGEGGWGWAETDYEGRYTVNGLTAGSYELNVEPPWGSEYASNQSRGITVGVDNTTTYDVILTTGGHVTGRIIDGGSNGVSNANVNAWCFDGGWGWTQSNSTGYYDLAGLATGTYEVQVEPPWGSNLTSNRTQGVQVTADSPTTGIDFTLTTGNKIYGWINSSEGAIQFTWVDAWSESGGWGWSDTNSAGYYEISGLMDGTYNVNVQPPWDSDFAGNSTRVEVSGQDKLHNVTLSSGNSISGRITYEDGGTSADYVFINAWTKGEGGGGWGWAETDSDGNYTISGLADGTYEVHVEPPWGSSYAGNWTTVTISSAPVTGIDMTLTSGNSISGYITDGSDGGVSWAHVDAWSEEGGWGWAETNSDGSYTLSGLTDGTYEVHVEPPWGTYDLASNHTKVTVAGSDIENVNMTLSTGHSISGRITQSGGENVSLAHVETWSETGGWGWADTDSNGNYTIKKLMNGEYEVHVSAPSGSGLMDNHTTVTINNGDETGVNMLLSGAYSISGWVKSSSDVVVANVKVKAWSPDTGAWSSDKTNLEGYYEIEGLAEGSYTLRAVPAANSGLASNETNATISGGTSATNINLTLPSEFVLSGRVKDNNGKPVANARVEAWNKSGSCGSTNTDTNGNYTIEGLPSGDYQIHVYPPSGSGFGEGHTTSVSQPPVYPVWGWVLNESTGAPVPAGVTVRITDMNLSGGRYVTDETDEDGLYVADIGAFGMPGAACGDYFVVNATYEGIGGSSLFIFDPVAVISQRCNITIGTHLHGLKTTRIASLLSALSRALQVSEDDFVIVLYPAGTITGTVTVGASPISGATVEVWNSSANIGKTTTTDSSGNFSINIAPGTYKLRAAYTGYASDLNESVIVTEGTPTALGDIVLSSTGIKTLSGTVTNGSVAINGVDVIAWNSTANNGHAVSNATGYYELKVPAGTYVMTAIWKGQENSTTIIIDEDKTWDPQFIGPVGLSTLGIAPLNGNQPPVADAGADQTVYANTKVTFDAAGSTDPDGTISSYFWNFNDGSTGTGISTTHTYTSVAAYNVTLTVTDNNGTIDQDYVTITVQAADIVAPTITHTPVTTASAGTKVDITATITDTSDVESATLFYKKSGDTNYSQVAMSHTDDAYSGSIPASFVTTGGVKYYIRAKDSSASKNIGYSPSTAPTTPNSITVSSADSQSPTITHTPEKSATAGTAVSISATITDTSGVESATLYYRVTGAANWSQASMTAAGDTYSATIPASSVTTAGVQYYIEAKDKASPANTGRSPSTAPGTPNPITVTSTSVPTITHTQITAGTAGNSITITATITDSDGVQSALLYYKVKGNGTWSHPPMSNESGSTTYSADIPASSVTTAGVYYYIEAEDANGLKANKPTDGQSLPYLITVSGIEEAGGEEGASPCYIATATYGTPLDSNIDVLRDFRDDVLFTTPVGAAFVATYYETSPPIADALRENDGLRTATRVTLIAPLVSLSGFAMSGTGIWVVFVIGLLAAVAFTLYFRRREKSSVEQRIVKSVLVGTGVILGFIAVIFSLGLLGYTIPFCAVIGAYLLPFVIPVAVTLALCTLLDIRPIQVVRPLMQMTKGRKQDE